MTNLGGARTTVYAGGPSPTGVTSWSYTTGGTAGTVLTGTATGCRRAMLVDVLIAPEQLSPADARSFIADALDRQPGLTLAAARLDRPRCLIGDLGGDLAVVGEPDVTRAAVTAYLWLTTGQALGSLGSLERAEHGLRALEVRPAHAVEQRHRFPHQVTGHVALVVAFGDLGRGHQQLGFVDGRA
ncbi:hypothetical protein SAMN04489732_107315 [Amycolatopsis saalfeldensis]|uniref:Uncharacterized protein n=1 Tax=Amycolatopsis saalfeldensis TaxID=394193 RepID=A0A1H8XIP4_9PSEU|nr:hypothetical protein SAMN04489732_107315 [Amycolatopsis saalfeldensis]